MMEKRQILLLIVIFLSLFVQAQELIVKGMQVTNDLSASHYRRTDINGEPCGLVKVGLASAGATFEGNVIKSVEYKTGEYWVYMSKGSRELRIKHPSYVPLHVYFSDYGINGIQSLTTYNLTLLIPQVVNMDVDDGNSFLAMKVEPKDAMVFIDNEPKTLQNGTLSILLPMGEHKYRVEAPAYETRSGSFFLGNETYKLDVRLESAMASLNINSTTKGTQIYVNDQLKGVSSWSGNLPPGIYRVEGRLQNYHNYRQSVTLVQHDNKQIIIPALQVKTGTLSVNYQPIDAEVWIDGKKAGTSPKVFRNIPIGNHNVELHKDGYITKKDVVIINEGKPVTISGELIKDTSDVISSIITEKDSFVYFSFYGNKLQVRFNDSRRFRIDTLNINSIAKCMGKLESVIKEGTIQECLKIKEELNLCDWAYLKLLDCFSNACLQDVNARTILMFALFLHSGYMSTILIDKAAGRVRLCYNSTDFPYETAYLTIGGKLFFVYGQSEINKNVIVHENFLQGKSVDLRTMGQQKFVEQLSNTRMICSKMNPDFSFSFSVNNYLLDFLEDYPSLYCKDNFDRLRFFVNQSFDKHLQNTLLKDMKEKMKDMSPIEAVQQLLWWVQSDIGKNDKFKRHQFPEESLFYPSSDLQDRSILLARLIRDIVGLDVSLVYYPEQNHLVAAVCFDDLSTLNNTDYVTVNGRKFVICDPTLFYAPVGHLASSVKGETKVYILK